MTGPRKRTRALAAAAGAALAFGLAACGSAAAPHTAAGAPTATTAAGAPTATAAASPSPACAGTVAGTLDAVAGRIYHDAAKGDDAAEAVQRVQSSAALAAAIAADDPRAAHAALSSLLLNQIVAIEVLRDGRRFATAGSGPAMAPVRGSIPGASFVLSVQADRTFARVAAQVTGAQVLVIGAGSGGARRRGGRARGEGRAPAVKRLAGTIAGPPPAGVPSSGMLSYAGKSYQVVSRRGLAYPSSSLRIVLLVPTGSISCPGSLARARVHTLGTVGELIYKEELHSPQVAATLRLLEGSGAFRRAVAEQSPTATREAIIGFFRAHIHVVRVRVSVGDRLLVDVGGPYVLAPVRGTLRKGGRVIGDFEMAIQDDAGYLKLAHLFTGAQVLMRIGSQQVMGTLEPGPASVPARGQVSYDGRAYEAYSFTGEAFPSGALRISLLFGG